jgi:hypothetical protein
MRTQPAAQENKMKKALIVKPSGEWEVKEFTDDNSLSTLQNAVDGLIAPIDLVGVKSTMWLDDEGLYRADFEENLLATAIYEQDYNLSNQRLMGNAVFTGVTDENGFTLGLDDQTLDLITQMAEYTKLLRGVAD